MPVSPLNALLLSAFSGGQLEGLTKSAFLGAGKLMGNGAAVKAFIRQMRGMNIPIRRVRPENSAAVLPNTSHLPVGSSQHSFSKVYPGLRKTTDLPMNTSRLDVGKGRPRVNLQTRDGNFFQTPGVQGGTNPSPIVSMFHEGGHALHQRALMRAARQSPERFGGAPNYKTLEYGNHVIPGQPGLSTVLDEIGANNAALQFGRQAGATPDALNFYRAARQNSFNTYTGAVENTPLAKHVMQRGGKGYTDDLGTMNLYEGFGKSAALPSISTLLRRALNQTHTHPTKAQIESGNYRKGTLPWKKMTIKIENPEGTTRRGVGKDGKAWESKMACSYGYIKGTKGKDGDALDVFLGPDLESDLVAVIDQEVDRKFDEHKIVVGIKSEDEARKLYLANYNKGWRCGPLTLTTVQGLRNWIASGDTNKPFAGQQKEAAALDQTTVNYWSEVADIIKNRIEKLPPAERAKAAQGKVNVTGRCGHSIQKGNNGVDIELRRQCFTCSIADAPDTDADGEEQQKAAAKDSCYYSAKSSYDVFPSARASQAIAKCRKAKGNVRKSEKGSDLKRWQSEKWKDQKTGEDCGAGEDNEYCRPTKRVSAETPKTSGEMTEAEKDRKIAEKSRVGMGDRVSDLDKAAFIRTACGQVGRLLEGREALEAFARMPGFRPSPWLLQTLALPSMEKAANAKWRMLQNIGKVALRAVKGDEIGSGTNLAALKQSVGGTLRSPAVDKIGQRVVRQKQLADDSARAPFRGDDDLLKNFVDRTRARSTHEKLFDRFGKEMPENTPGSVVFRGTVGGNPWGGGTYNGAFHYAAPTHAGAAFYGRQPAAFLKNETRGLLSSRSNLETVHQYQAGPGQKLWRGWGPEDALTASGKKRKALVRDNFSDLRGSQETAVMPQHNPYLGTSLRATSADGSYGTGKFFPAGRPATAAQNYVNQVSQKVTPGPSGVLQQAQQQVSGLNTTAWQASVNSNPALLRLQQRNPQAFQEVMNRRADRILAPTMTKGGSAAPNSALLLQKLIQAGIKVTPEHLTGLQKHLGALTHAGAMASRDSADAAIRKSMIFGGASLPEARKLFYGGKTIKTLTGGKKSPGLHQTLQDLISHIQPPATPKPTNLTQGELF
jgi:hypothetical protein